MRDVVGVVLGGGRGTRLLPLTLVRSKPAVPFAGKYRIVDLPISNCIHSEVSRIFVLTQFNSASLNRHIAQTYNLGIFSRGFVEILAAEQTMENLEWFQGTADAVRQTLTHILSEDPKHILILSGDQLYRMDYRLLHTQHIANRADISVAVLPIPVSRASSFGVLKVDERGQIVSFREKPQDRKDIEQMQSPAAFMRRFGITAPGKSILASMGIYLFEQSILDQLLRDSKMVDFGHDIIPSAIGSFRAFAYPFDGYWEDIGTIKSFFQAHLDLTEDIPCFDLFDTKAPIFTHPRFLPPSRIHSCKVLRSIISDGCIVSGSSIEQSVLGVRSVIAEGANLRRTLLMGADYYERPDRHTKIRMGIGKDCNIQNAIIDKDARIGEGVKIRDHSHSADCEGPNYYIRDGIAVIPKGAVLPDGTEI
ncbi:MAG: glucose-1-phosphate adenylyltransferase [Acidobacteria bacterium]|nr:glucose-1-phosphate adenylyltransferase [Acidobacteriota bacterium]